MATFLNHTASPVFGVVFHQDVVVRIINPDFEWQLDLHALSPGEYMIRIAKETFGVSTEPDAMTLAQVHNICEAL